MFVYTWLHPCHVTVTSFLTAIPTLSTKNNLDLRRLVASEGTVHVGFVENKVAMRNTMIPSIFRTFTNRSTLKRWINGCSSRFRNRRHHKQQESNAFLVAFANLWKATLSFVMSIRPHGTTRFPLDGLSWNIIFEYLLQNLSKKFMFRYNLTRITGTLHENQYSFSIISRSFLLRMRNISDRSCTENQKTHFMFTNLLPENRTVHEIMWKNTVQPGRATDDNMAHMHWVLDTQGYKHTLRICNTLLFHCNNCCTNVPQCYVICTLPV
jgi:hypothetical protein